MNRSSFLSEIHDKKQINYEGGVFYIRYLIRAVENIDCISVEDKDFPNDCTGYDATGCTGYDAKQSCGVLGGCRY